MASDGEVGLKGAAMVQPDRVSKFLGGLLGTAVGGAIGKMAFEHPDAESLHAAVAVLARRA